MKVEFEWAFAVECGDYYQVLFRTEDSDDSPYVLIQRQFEEPDGGKCYVETHHADYNGHCRVVHASLSRNRLRVKLSRRKATELEVSFRSSHPNDSEVIRILRIIIPQLEVLDTGSDSTSGERAAP